MGDGLEQPRLTTKAPYAGVDVGFAAAQTGPTEAVLDKHERPLPSIVHAPPCGEAIRRRHAGDASDHGVEGWHVEAIGVAADG